MEKKNGDKEYLYGAIEVIRPRFDNSYPSIIDKIINESVNKKLKVKELINMLKQYNPDANVIFYTYQQDPDYLNYNLEPTPMDSIEQNYDGDVEIVISD